MSTARKYQGPISLALLLALILLLGFLLLLPVMERHNRYEFELLRDGRQLQRLQSIEASRAELESLERAYQERGLGDWFYEAKYDSNSIGLDIQRRVTAALAESEVQLRSITPLPSQRRGAEQVLGVRVNFNGSMPALLASLQRLEQEKPLLQIEDFRINPSAQRNAQSGGTAEQRAEVQMSVVTLLPGEPSTSGAE
ncbi:MAG: type II secretion system protein GspM [Pseudomonadota bacterium]